MSSLAGLLWLVAAGQYTLTGRILPASQASVTLYGATTPFAENTLTDSGGRFHFRKLQAGTYTIAVFVPGRGEARRTIEIGPSLADKKGRVPVTLELSDSHFENGEALRRGSVISARQLAIPAKALQGYEEAQKCLARRDVSGAIERLTRAVEVAPQYAVAWNNLGTIAYQTRRFVQAEEYFRKSLEADPESFEPLVNLGGALVTQGKAEEALKYNLHAVLTRPGDALANSQLGMTYFQLGKLDLAQKYLSTARRIDPAHFSHPQLMLAQIYLRRGDRAAAAEELEDFLRRHPDDPQAAKIKADLVRLHQ